MTQTVEIYTDGACRGNPGVGGWGAWLKYNETNKEICGGEYDTTNNRMELTAAIKALQLLTRPCKVKIYTDSQYLRKGMTEWLTSWLKRDWRTASKKPVKNKDLWQELVVLTEKHQVEWVWVKAHVGIEGNEMADQLANKGIDELEVQA
ncbi:MAG: ribonuclease HI [Arenicella sp.]